MKYWTGSTLGLAQFRPGDRANYYNHVFHEVARLESDPQFMIRDIVQSAQSKICRPARN